MRPGEPADELRFAIWFHAALCEIGKILEEVAKQLRVAFTRLFQGRMDNVRRVLRKRELRALYISHEPAEARSRRLEASPDGALDFIPSKGAIRDDAGPGCLGQVQGHLEIRCELEHV